MYHPGGTIKKQLDKIASNEYVLPAIQREFVWSQEQICRLFDSVMQGYPFGEFLFWRIEAQNSADFRYYGFVREYHQRDNPHCPDLGELPNQQMIAVLDGQQRLTAFNIGLRGSMSVKLPNKWWKSADAFPCRFLALDLLGSKERDEEGNAYSFEFVSEDQLGYNGGHLWFKVSKILTMKEGPDMLDWLIDQNLEKQQQGKSFRILHRLFHVIHTKHTVAYYEEENQDIEHVLSIFIRRNSGGTILSYSDLLLSIATSQWTNLDARKEVHKLTDDLNAIGPNFGITKDFVLKGGLMLTDISSVGFKVRNFTRHNMKILEDNWQKIRDALVQTVQLVAGFGFSAKSIRAISALLPIAYYIYRIESPQNFYFHKNYANERKVIHDWLIRSILKASGIWGSGQDTLLSSLREVIRKMGNGHFPAMEMKHHMRKRGKSLEFSHEEIDDICDMELRDRRVFALLSLLTPFIDFQNHNFHVDHVFPKSLLTKRHLRKFGIEGENLDKFVRRSNRIANLQLLDGSINQEKQAMLPAMWIENRYPEENKLLHYCEQYCLGDFKTFPREVTGFLQFYKARRERLKCRILKLIDVN